ncbi:MAG: dihydroorotase family protein [Thermoplasmata archaeon]|nr:dihydroorotase family protein [Thermoplasmata archaeon]
MDMVIEGDCYQQGEFKHLEIGIDNGKIVKVAKSIDCDKRMNFGSKKILPAAIDPHVHFRDPGMTHKEDFRSGSIAALHGGVTCVFDMPNTKPPTTSIDFLNEKRGIALSRSHVDFGLFAGVQPGIDVEGLAEKVIGFKLYMAGTTGNLLVPSLRSIGSELSRIAKCGKVLAVHAEDESLRDKERDEKNLHDHLAGRNNDCETSAIRKIADAAPNCRLHICHVSARESIPLVFEQKNMTAEVSPHHLLLDRDRPIGSLGKVNPPLRTRADRQALCLALKQGRFDMIASDHAPHTMDEKSDDFQHAPCGMPGVETMYPLMLQLVRERHLALATVVRAMCEKPGEIFKIPKGKIEPGYDADLVVVDFMEGSEIRGDRLLTKCGWSAFDGMSCIFPKAVFAGGELMMEDGSQSGDRMGREVIGK